MITKYLLLITGEGNFSIINVNLHKIEKIIKIPDSSYISSFCMLNENTIRFGNENKIEQWKFEGDNLKLISIKENVYDNFITALMKLGDQHILSVSAEGDITIWNIII